MVRGVESTTRFVFSYLNILKKKAYDNNGTITHNKCEFLLPRMV